MNCLHRSLSTALQILPIALFSQLAAQTRLLCSKYNNGGEHAPQRLAGIRQKQNALWPVSALRDLRHRGQCDELQWRGFRLALAALSDQANRNSAAARSRPMRRTSQIEILRIRHRLRAGFRRTWGFLPDAARRLFHGGPDLLS